ncbi:MAG: RNA-binding domain-containing protein [Chlamydiota bacterium]
MKYPEPKSSFLEFKREMPKKDQIIKTIIGFCNRYGGKVIIGIDDDRTIIGLSDEIINEIMESLDRTIYEATTPPILPSVYTRMMDNKTILCIEVSKGMNKPYYRRSEGLENGVYIRVGRHTLRANADLNEELRWQSRGISFDTLPVYQADTELHLDEKKIHDFFQKRKGRSKVNLTRELVEAYGLIVKDHGKSYPTIAGLLLFGKNPEQYLSEAMIICTHFAGVEGREALATKDCTGTLFEQYQEATAFILSRLYRSFTIKGFERKETLEVPEVALREVLLNMLVHRNYHLKTPAKISIYDDRIEFFSPGDFPGPLDAHNLLDGMSFLRNPAICRAFREAHLIEKLGTGLITLFNSYKQIELPRPQVLEGISFVKCVLPRSTPEILRLQPEKTLPTNLKNIYDLFEVANEITISHVVATLNLPRSTAGRHLAALERAKLIIKKGTGRSARYVLDIALNGK